MPGGPHPRSHAIVIRKVFTIQGSTFDSMARCMRSVVSAIHEYIRATTVPESTFLPLETSQARLEVNSRSSDGRRGRGVSQFIRSSRKGCRGRHRRKAQKLANRKVSVTRQAIGESRTELPHSYLKRSLVYERLGSLSYRVKSEIYVSVPFLYAAESPSGAIGDLPHGDDSTSFLHSGSLNVHFTMTQPLYILGSS
jgi:hypothetical protein